MKLRSYDIANILGYKDRGIIAPGMLADFFLVPGDPVKDLKAIKIISSLLEELRDLLIFRTSYGYLSKTYTGRIKRRAR